MSNGVTATRLVLVQKTSGSNPGWTTYIINSVCVGIGIQATLRW